MSNFRFIEENHIYLLDDIQIPSVTQVLPYNFFGNDSEYNKERGKKVHKMIELYNMKNLNENTLDPALVPYLTGYKKFIADNGTPKGIFDIKTGTPQQAEPLQLAGYALLVREGLTDDNKKAEWTFEVPLYHPIYRFAGTPDIVNINREESALRLPMPFAMHCLYLNSDGIYKLSPDYSKDYRKNREIFLSFLTCWKWKNERELNNGNDFRMA